MTSSEMAVAHAASPGGAGATATPENPGAVLGQNDFLKLMIAQLQAQDPLQPANTNEYVSELAQFTQVEQTTNIAASSQLAGAVQLIGHTISYNNGLGETVVDHLLLEERSDVAAGAEVEGVGDLVADGGCSHLGDGKSSGGDDERGGADRGELGPDRRDRNAHAAPVELPGPALAPGPYALEAELP